jgi:SAM-dependent methyltransferase
VSQSMNAWDEIFAREGRFFLEPHQDMPGIVRLLRERVARAVLDLGSGTGRHVAYLAQRGFSVSGLDNSREGMEATRRWLAGEGLEAGLRLQSMTERFPCDDEFFDAVVSVQAIHHADLATIRGTVAEINCVLKQGGFLFVTVPKLKNQGQTFEQWEPSTFVPLDGPEKGLPHHYFTTEELQEVFRDYNIFDIHLDGWEHYCLSAFKRQAREKPLACPGESRAGRSQISHLVPWRVP